MKLDQQDRSFDMVKIKYLRSDGIKSGIFTKLTSRTTQRRPHVTYKIDSGVEGNLMPFTIFKTFFQSQQLKHCMPQNSVQ